MVVSKKHLNNIANRLAKESVKMEENFIVTCLGANGIPLIAIRNGEVSIRKSDKLVKIFHIPTSPKFPIGIYTKPELDVVNKEVIMKTKVLTGKAGDEFQYKTVKETTSETAPTLFCQMAKQ